MADIPPAAELIASAGTGDSPAPFMPQLSFKSYSKDGGAEGLGEAAHAQPEKKNGCVPLQGSAGCAFAAPASAHLYSQGL